MSTFLQDVKTALKTMCSLAAEFLIALGKGVLMFSTIILVFGTLGYFFYHFFWQSLTVVIMAMLCTWFWVELKTARFVREQEEKQEAYWAEKSKPAHENIA